MADLLISADVETDGPIPGPYSMISLGMAVIGRYDGVSLERHDPTAQTFYRELRPISDDFDPEALAVSGLDREVLLREGEDPRSAMSAAHAWVKSVGGKDRPIFVAWPLSFDWMFAYWYFVRFAERGSPFGFSGCTDLKTVWTTLSGSPTTGTSKGRIPRALRSQRPHTHNALDDALEQADLAANILEWAIARRSAT